MRDPTVATAGRPTTSRKPPPLSPPLADRCGQGAVGETSPADLQHFPQQSRTPELLLLSFATTSPTLISCTICR